MLFNKFVPEVNCISSFDIETPGARAGGAYHIVGLRVKRTIVTDNQNFRRKIQTQYGASMVS